ncbi:B-block-binding subunit of tfiiic [Cryptosporidium sp. chipmunk genotype I]|uniref:B-block-binding subunit of tfiiic n=1 Tax=Cryptosporidium sp. chipmunk genotype I TaxID=1280935 RepID=UPI003519ECB1|nr:B-block-binding subunit of tfiiic [Cryptosporidium sp. chipmunk genotype I]
MDVIFSRITLEELSFLGSNGSSIEELFSKVTSRILSGPYRNFATLLNNVFFKKKIIKIITSHKHIKIKNKLNGIVYSFENGSDYNCSENLLFVANDCIKSHILDLNIFSNISEVEGRLSVYMAIASKGFSGCWQYEISRMLKMDPKMVFQHLKYLYKYDNIVRFSIPMPINHKKRLFPNEDSNSSSGGHLSAIIWLTRFFDINLIPREFSQLIWYQHIQPLSAEIVRILEHKAPGKIAWEKDIRTLCSGFLIFHDENSADHLICSQRTANKVFNKLRDFLLTKNVRRVFAWHPLTKSYSPCLCLKDAFPSTTVNLSSETTVKTETHVAELNITSNEEFNCQKNMLNKEGKANTNTNNGLFRDLYLEEIHVSTGNKIFEITEAAQVLWLIRASGRVGLVSLDIVKIIGINMKRLGKLLSDLCKTKIINKIPQRYNRTFMYRYYFNGIFMALKSDTNSKVDKLTIEPGSYDKNKTGSKSETKNIMAMFNETFPNKKIELSGVTEQFVKRLILMKRWLDEPKILTIPEIAKLFSETESTRNGPDRKTIKRILSKILELDDYSKETSIAPSKSNNKLSSSGEVAIFFSSKFYTEDEARNLKAIELKNKRSSTTKSAIERRKKELSQVAAIIDASNSLPPNKQKEDLVITRSNHSADTISSPIDTKVVHDNLNQANIPRLITNEIGDATVILNTPDFMVSSLNIEINGDGNSMVDSSNSKRNCYISKLDIPGTEFIKKMSFDPSKRISLGFSNLSKGGIKILSSQGKIGFLSFNQKILAHYGFVFPIMIRLKILHQHLLFLCQENEFKCNLMSSIEILDNMTIDIFLRVIGFGHRSKFIEEYLLYGGSETFKFGPNTRIKELPSNLYEKLTRNYTKKNFFGYGKKKNMKNYDKGRKAITVLYKLLLLLCKLNFINFSISEAKEIDKSDLAISNIDQINIETVPVSSPTWKLEYDLKIPILIHAEKYEIERLTEYIKHTNDSFSLKTGEQFEQFWAVLNRESIDTHNFIIEFKLENYTVIFPDILLKRNWKINPLLQLNVRNQLEKYARQLLFENVASNTLNESENKSQIVLSLASPEIKNISNKLSINPLTTLKYLIRVVDSLSLEEFNFANNPDSFKKISFHPIRDPRYQCHICNALYSTHPAVISHYKTIHNIYSITNSSMYTIKKDSSLISKNKNINFNSTIKTQILSENYIPNTLKHLLDLKETENICNEIERTDKIELLRAFLRLCKEDIILLYIILFISDKLNTNNSNLTSKEYLFRILSFCKEKKTESNLFSLQFLRINSLIQEITGISKYNLIHIIEFIFSCLKTIYPLNSKLLEAIKLKERQRICWNHLLEINSFSNRWRAFARRESNSPIIASDIVSTLNNSLNNGYCHNCINYVVENSETTFSKIDYFIVINLIKSELLTQKKIIQDKPIFRLADYNILNEERIKNYFEDSIKKNVLKQIHRNSDLSKFEESLHNSSNRFSLTRRMLLNCFGKTIVWREIFNLCFAFLQINYSKGIKFNSNAHNSNGAFVLNHLNNLIENRCFLEIEWNDRDFYEKVSNKTDEELFRLLNEAVDQQDSFENFTYESNSYTEKSMINSQFLQNKINSNTKKLNEKILNKIDNLRNLEYVQAGNNESPAISNITAVYLNKQIGNNYFPNLMELEYSSVSIPFLGTMDSDPLEFNKIPSIFSISDILLSFSESKFKNSNRQTIDPIFTIIKAISRFMINYDSYEHNLIMKSISIIIFTLKNTPWLTMNEIEDIFFVKFSDLVSELSLLGSKFIDPGICFYEFRLPIIYHIIYLLEILKICIRISAGGNWLFSIFCSFNNKLIEYKTEKYSNNNNNNNNKNSNLTRNGNISIPINVPTRIWLLWSNEVVLQLFNEKELTLVINNINKSLSEVFKFDNFIVPCEIFLNRAPINCFVSVDGQINLPICGLLIYFISSLTYKSPIFNLSEFTSRFSFFSSCEIELILESMFAENCLYKDNTKIIFSKPIQDIFKVYEGYL